MLSRLLLSVIYFLGSLICVAPANADTDLAEATKRIEAAPINCGTADGDLRVLAAEREHAEKSKLQGLMAITPTGILFGAVTGTQHKHYEILTGDYIKHIDQKTALIKAKCGK